MKKIFKIIVVGLALALFIPTTSVKAQPFDQGDIVISAGIGLGATWYTGTYYKTTVPPIWLTGDYCLMEDLGPGNLGVGAYLGYSAYKSTWHYLTETYGWKYTTFIIGVRGTYHFVDLVNNLDLYGGILLGGRILSSKYYGSDLYSSYHSATGSGVAYSFFAGARYLFTPNIGVMAELGYGIAYLSLGVSFRF